MFHRTLICQRTEAAQKAESFKKTQRYQRLMGEEEGKFMEIFKVFLAFVAMCFLLLASLIVSSPVSRIRFR